MEIPSTRRVCDVCGEPASDVGASCTIHAPSFYGDSEYSEVWYEWSPAGDYCDEHLKELCNAFVEAMPLPDRYNRGDRNERHMELERSMIEGYEKEHPKYL